MFFSISCWGGVGGGGRKRAVLVPPINLKLSTLKLTGFNIFAVIIIIIIMSLFYEDDIFSKQCTNLTYGPL